MDRELAWYKWLSVCPIPGIDWKWELRRPRDGDVSSVAHLVLNIGTDPRCGIEWRIGAEGNRIKGTLVAPTYRLARTLNPSLPATEEFGLEDTPPGE